MLKKITEITTLMQTEKQPETAVCAGEGYEDRGRALAASLGLPFLSAEEVGQGRLRLTLDSGGLSLGDGRVYLSGDFSVLGRRAEPHRLREEYLVRAVAGKEPPSGGRVLDATAGLGEDSFLLAAAGYEVELYERDPIIAALLADSLERAWDSGMSEIAARMHLHRDDSIAAMKELDYEPYAVLLDPMFPERQKSGSVKKKFQLLGRLEQPCTDEEELMNAALLARPKKIVVKRPLHGPYLAGRIPSHSYSGRIIRYDCILPG